jgi:hypothetical protein
MTTQEIKIGQDVTFTGCHGVNVVEAIGAKTAVLRCKLFNTTSKKRISSLKAHETPVSYWNEQELADGQLSKHNHGAVVYSVLSASGNGSKMVWDDIKKDVVSSKEL